MMGVGIRKVSLLVFVLSALGVNANGETREEVLSQSLAAFGRSWIEMGPSLASGLSKEEMEGFHPDRDLRVRGRNFRRRSRRPLFEARVQGEWRETPVRIRYHGEFYEGRVVYGGELFVEFGDDGFSLSERSSPHSNEADSEGGIYSLFRFDTNLKWEFDPGAGIVIDITDVAINQFAADYGFRVLEEIKEADPERGRALVDGNTTLFWLVGRLFRARGYVGFWEEFADLVYRMVDLIKRERPTEDQIQSKLRQLRVLHSRWLLVLEDDPDWIFNWRRVRDAFLAEMVILTAIQEVGEKVWFDSQSIYENDDSWLERELARGGHSYRDGGDVEPPERGTFRVLPLQQGGVRWIYQGSDGVTQDVGVEVADSDNGDGRVVIEGNQIFVQEGNERLLVGEIGEEEAVSFSPQLRWRWAGGDQGPRVLISFRDVELQRALDEVGGSWVNLGARMRPKGVSAVELEFDPQRDLRTSHWQKGLRPSFEKRVTRDGVERWEPIRVRVRSRGKIQGGLVFGGRRDSHQSIRAEGTRGGDFAITDQRRESAAGGEQWVFDQDVRWAVDSNDGLILDTTAIAFTDHSLRYRFNLKEDLKGADEERGRRIVDESMFLRRVISNYLSLLEELGLDKSVGARVFRLVDLNERYGLSLGEIRDRLRLMEELYSADRWFPPSWDLDQIHRERANRLSEIVVLLALEAREEFDIEMEPAPESEAGGIFVTEIREVSHETNGSVVNRVRAALVPEPGQVRGQELVDPEASEWLRQEIVGTGCEEVLAVRG